MKTAQEFIAEYQKLPLEEKQMVVDYVISTEIEVFPEEDYSPDDIAKILKSGEEAERGINVESFSSMSEARKSLGLSLEANNHAG